MNQRSLEVAGYLAKKGNCGFAIEDGKVLLATQGTPVLTPVSEFTIDDIEEAARGGLLISIELTIRGAGAETLKLYRRFIEKSI